MRHSARLTGKDYRDLLEIIDLTYGASCPDALFPALFEKLAKAIGCNSAVYQPVGDGCVPKFKAGGAIVVETSPQLAREYAEHYWALDPFNLTGWTKQANRAARITDLTPASKYLNSEFAIDFCARVPASWGLAGTLGNPGQPVGVMALHRIRSEHNFSYRDVPFMRALLPHVSRALLFFRERTKRPCATGILILDDIGAVVYSNEAAAHILNGQSPEAIPWPIGPAPRKAQTIFRSDHGDHVVGLEIILGNYKLMSLEPVKRESVRSLLAALGLTPRQQEIASRVLLGASNKRIAGELNLAEQTVKDHINVIFRKLGIHHRAELAARVIPLPLDNDR